MTAEDIMKPHTVVAVFACVFSAALLSTPCNAADHHERTQIMPNEIRWAAVPAVPSLKISWLTGAQDRAGLYELRVHLDKGAMVPPHTHPDRRCVTVLQGNLYAAEGSTVDAAGMKRFPPGSFHCVDAGVPHYVIARDSEVDFQDSGIAPTGTVWIRK
jgi:quercetin dioxygenase-like cupin family protein